MDHRQELAERMARHIAEAEGTQAEDRGCGWFIRSPKTRVQP